MKKYLAGIFAILLISMCNSHENDELKPNSNIHSAPPLNIIDQPKLVFNMTDLPEHATYYKDIAAGALVFEVAQQLNIDLIGNYNVYQDEAAKFMNLASTEGGICGPYVYKYTDEELLSFLRACKETFNDLSPTQKKDCFMSECIEWDCPTNRYRNPNVRKVFEDSIIKQAKSLKSVCTYVSFGSGMLQQDAIILDKLAKTKKEINTIILIDPLYRCLFWADPARRSITVSACDEPFTPPDGISHIYTLRQQQDPASCQHKQPFLDTLCFCLASKMFDQFKSFVYQSHINKPIIKIYENIDNYIEDCKKHRAPKANILCKCDVDIIGDFDPVCLHNTCIEEDGLLIDLIRLDAHNVDLLISKSNELVQELQYRHGFWQWFGIPGAVYSSAYYLGPWVAACLFCAALSKKITEKMIPMCI